MCGIAGIAALDPSAAPNAQQISAMCSTMVHRGPDDEGVHVQDGVGLGMRRLSVIDLNHGQQPIFNEDRSVRTVFNGEIYNYPNLRATLQKKGHTFSTESDTEVIVHAYEEYGADFPNYLNGMFAIALHDMRQKKMYLVRDHVGIKPLFYAYTGSHLVWGSEIKALQITGLVSRELDFNALSELLAWEYVPGSGTLFKGVRKLEPGQILELDLVDSKHTIQNYWDIPLNTHQEKHTDEEWIEIVGGKLKQCVQRQLISDVPLGAFLSGGVDSSLVVEAIGDVETYSIGFDDPTYNELAYSSKVASHLGVNHTTEIIKPYVADLFDDLMYYMDDPIGDFSIFPTYLVSKLARQHVTVALSGDGADEMFGGYETYVANLAAQHYALAPNIVRSKLVEPLVASIKPSPAKKGLVNKLKRFVEGMSNGDELGHARWRIFTGELLKHRLFTPEALEQMDRPIGAHIEVLHEKAGERDAVNRSLYVDMKSYLVDNCLVKTDRMSMAVSLEARVPFLDKELVELAFQIPGSLKVRGKKTKVLLKQLAARRIPRDCVYRQKEGFSIPIKHWLNAQFQPVMEAALNSDRLRREGIFQTETVEKLKLEHAEGTANHSHVLWSLIMFQSWRSRWLEG